MSHYTNLRQDITENEMARKYVIAKSCVTDAVLFSNSCCLEIEVKKDT